MKSDNLNELAGALAKAQGEMSGAKKDSENPFFKSRYADLASVWDAIRLPLSKNGLSVSQGLENSGSGPVLRSILLHSSGQWIDSEYPIKVSKEDAQGLGAGVSYARRYSLAALVGIYQDDDDGEEAVGRKQDKAPAPIAEQKVEPKKDLPSDSQRYINQGQAAAIYRAAKDRGFSSRDDVKAFLSEAFGVESALKIPVSKFQEALDAVRGAQQAP